MADNCEDDTIEMCADLLQGRNHMGYCTNEGNAGSFRWCVNLIPNLMQMGSEPIYFLEDDYLHRDISVEKELERGLELGDYATLYDHPDKYQSEYDFGETSQLLRLGDAHWKTTISTTMTFATTQQVIQEDAEIWLKHTKEDHPTDHECFEELKERDRKLVCRIPGLSHHTDLTYFDEKRRSDLMENWVLKEIEDHFLEQLLPES